jgi:PEGA domain
MTRTSWIIFGIAAMLGAASICCAAPQAAAAEHKSTHARKADSFVTGPPLTLEQVRWLLHEDAIPLRRRKEAIQNRGVAFAMSPAIVAKLKSAGATDEVLDLIQSKIAPPKVHVAAPPPPPAPHGGLDIKCAPAECEVSLNGTARGASDGGVMELAGITPGKWAVDISKAGYISKQSEVTIEADKTASISAVLDPTRATQETLGAALFQKVVDALGGEDGLKALSSVQATGSTNIARDGNIVRWTVLMRNRPDRALFQVRAGSILHEIGFVGNEFTASKHLKGQDAMELPTDFGFIRDNQLAALITRLRNSRYMLVAKRAVPVPGDEFQLFAEGNTDKISIGLDSQLRPQRVRITTETGVGAATITYDDYFKSEDTWYPKIMRIKPDGDTHGIEIHFDTVQLNADLKDSDYKLRGKPLVNLVN